MEEDEDAENFYSSFSYPSSPRSLQLFFSRARLHTLQKAPSQPSQPLATAKRGGLRKVPVWEQCATDTTATATFLPP